MKTIHSQHQCVAYERGQSFQEPYSQICLQRKCRISHRQSLLAGFFRALGSPWFISRVADGPHTDEGECEAVENSEEEEANASAKRRGGRAYKCERLKYYARWKEVYLGIQDENQSMSIPTTTWKGIISITGRVTFVPDDLVLALSDE